MKLDRNKNPDGRGKYALINLRKFTDNEHRESPHVGITAREAVDVLDSLGLIHWGNEGPGEQFFVMKYKDRFTAPALSAYACEVLAFAEATQNQEQISDLREYGEQMQGEALMARQYGNKIPD